jgi:hypothetical protein
MGNAEIQRQGSPGFVHGASYWTWGEGTKYRVAWYAEIGQKHV